MTYYVNIFLSTTGHKLIIDMNIPLSNHFTIHPPGDITTMPCMANVRCFPGYYIYICVTTGYYMYIS